MDGSLLTMTLMFITGALGLTIGSMFTYAMVRRPA